MKIVYISSIIILINSINILFKNKTLRLLVSYVPKKELVYNYFKDLFDNKTKLPNITNSDIIVSLNHYLHKKKLIKKILIIDNKILEEEDYNYNLKNNEIIKFFSNNEIINIFSNNEMVNYFSKNEIFYKFFHNNNYFVLKCNYGKINLDHEIFINNSIKSIEKLEDITLNVLSFVFYDNKHCLLLENYIINLSQILNLSNIEINYNILLTNYENLKNKLKLFHDKNYYFGEIEPSKFIWKYNNKQLKLLFLDLHFINKDRVDIENLIIKNLFFMPLHLYKYKDLINITNFEYLDNYSLALMIIYTIIMLSGDLYDNLLRENTFKLFNYSKNVDNWSYYIKNYEWMMIQIKINLHNILRVNINSIKYKEFYCILFKK